MSQGELIQTTIAIIIAIITGFATMTAAMLWSVIGDLRKDVKGLADVVAELRIAVARMQGAAE